MKIIHNRWIPFGAGMYAINLFGIIFTKRNLSPIDKNHEYIHTMQQRELLYVGFYVMYVVEWLVRVVQTRSFLRGYFRISFEREAYDNQRRLDYHETRRRWAWRKYL